MPIARAQRLKRCATLERHQAGKKLSAGATVCRPAQVSAPEQVAVGSAISHHPAIRRLDIDHLAGKDQGRGWSDACASRGASTGRQLLCKRPGPAYQRDQPAGQEQCQYPEEHRAAPGADPTRPEAQKPMDAPDHRRQRKLVLVQVADLNWMLMMVPLSLIVH